MVRAPRIDENGIKKGAWSADEDNKLRSYLLKYGHPINWRELPKYAGLSRCGKSCRLRWVNYLRPDVKHGNYTKEEDDLIIKLHDELGNKWSAIAKKFPGRSDNEIKNHWHTHLKKRSKRNIHIFPKKESSGDLESASEADKKEQRSKSSPLTELNGHQQFTETSLFEVNKGKESTSDASSGYSSSTQLSSLSFDSSVFDRMAEESMLSSESFGETLESFWREPFLRDIDTAEYMHFPSHPSPIRGEEFLWSYEFIL